MTSTSMEQQISDNQTSSFMETSTVLGNLSCGNNSWAGNETLNKTISSVGRAPFSGTYIYGYWGIVLFVVAMGLIGNVLLLIMMREKQLSSLSYSVYLKWLAVSDSFVLITGIIRETEKIFSLQGLSLLSNATCKIFFSSRYLVTILSPWLVVGLTLDRFICVSFPLTRNIFCTQRKATIFCFTVLVLFILLTVPFLFNIDLGKGKCIPSEEVKYYFIILRLLLSSIVPCLVILVLNILIIIQMNRSYKFRKTFSKTRPNSSNTQDKATRPLVLVSILAFVTLLPLSLSEAVSLLLEILKTDFYAWLLTKKVWLILYIIYILNFAQNFYILIGSSSNYRDIIKRMLVCRSGRKVEINQNNQVTGIESNISLTHSSIAGAGTTDLYM